MSMERWDPVREMMNLRDTVERMLYQNRGRPPRTTLPALLSRVPVDVVEKGDSFEVRASLPGIKPEDVNISLRGSTLTIRGETSTEQQRTDENWILRERHAGAFSRSVTLPAPVDADSASARFERGVLVLTIPKVEAEKARQIQISGAQETPTERSWPIATGGSASQSPHAGTVSHSGATPEERHAHGRDTVTESSMESFPASDPPSWSRGQRRS